MGGTININALNRGLLRECLDNNNRQVVPAYESSLSVHSKVSELVRGNSFTVFLPLSIILFFD